MRGKLYYSAKQVKIYHGDILTLKNIKENSVDLIVTSPPYNLDIQYKGYQDNQSYDDYLQLCKRWFAHLLKLTKTDGRFCINIL